MAGFSLSQDISRRRISYRYVVGICAGIALDGLGADIQEIRMPLTDLFVRPVKHKGSPMGERYIDGGGMYLRVKAAGGY